MFESLPFAVITCVYLLLEPSETVLDGTSSLQMVALFSMMVSVISIVLSLYVYDKPALFKEHPKVWLHFGFFLFFFVFCVCFVTNFAISQFFFSRRQKYRKKHLKNKTKIILWNTLFRITTIVPRILLISFMIAFFDWWVVLLVLFVPVVAYSGHYKLYLSFFFALCFFFDSFIDNGNFLFFLFFLSQLFLRV